MFSTYWLRAAALLIGVRCVRADTNYSPLPNPAQVNQVIQLGEVTVDPRAGTLSIPAFVNMAEGTVEYFLVHSTGKVHESVLRTDVPPFQFHAAALLLMPQGQSNIVLKAESAPYELSGTEAMLWASWTNHGEMKRVPVEQMVFNIEQKKPMIPGPWLYNGSRTINGLFLAQRDGSFVSIIEDLDAIINDPRPGRGNDDIWQVNTNVVPPVGTQVLLEVQFPVSKPTHSANIRTP